MSNVHVYQCVVHQPNSVRRQSKHLHKPPRTVTEENQKFWKGDALLGTFICKKCFSQFTNCEKNNLKQIETSPNENMI
jgi:hypothetical protein